jgi:hypothetical protein
MFGGNDNSDKALQKLVDRRLERGGTPGLKAVVMRGSVSPPESRAGGRRRSSRTGRLSCGAVKMRIVDVPFLFEFLHARH